MSDPFDNVNLLRIIKEAETIFDKPGSEEVISQMRENWEVFLMLAFYTGDSGTATQEPTETVLTDSGAAYDVDEHNGRSLVMIDGLADGNIYTIDDTAAQTVTCTGDTLLADGVRSGDAYKIFYNLKNTTAHTHNDVDSKNVALAAGTVMLPPIMSEVATAREDLTNPNDTTWYDMDAGTALFKWKVYVPATADVLRMWVRAARHGGNSSLDVRFTLDGNASTDTGNALNNTIVYTEHELTLDVGALSLAPGWYDLIIQEETGNDGGEDVSVQGFSFCWENT